MVMMRAIAKSKKKLRKVLGKNKLLFSRLIAGGILIGSVIGGIYIMQRHDYALDYKISGVSIDWLPAGVLQRRQEINDQAARYNIEADLVAIIMTLESGGYVKADSGLAEGLMQITPYTAEDISTKHLIEPTDSYNLFDPKTSIEFGVSYLSYLRNTFCGKKGELPEIKCIEMVAAGYNGGPGAANIIFKDEPLIEDETIIYSRNAVKMWQERRASTSPTYQAWLKAGGQSLVDKAVAS